MESIVIGKMFYFFITLLLAIIAFFLKSLIGEFKNLTKTVHDLDSSVKVILTDVKHSDRKIAENSSNIERLYDKVNQNEKDVTEIKASLRKKVVL